MARRRDCTSHGGSVLKHDDTSAEIAQRALQDLQKNNARASHLILRLLQMPLQHPRFKALCEELTPLERSMMLQTCLCEQIVDSSVQEDYVIQVIFGTTCDYCLKSGRTRELQDNKPNSEAQMWSPAWAIQIEQLSVLTTSVVHKISQASFLPRRTVEQFASLIGASEQSSVAAATSSAADFRQKVDENRSHRRLQRRMP